MKKVQTPAEVIADLKNQIAVYSAAKFFNIQVLNKSRETTFALNGTITELTEQVNSLLDEVRILKHNNLCGKHFIEMALSFMAGAESIEAMQTALNDGALNNYLQGINDSLNPLIPNLDKVQN